MTGQVDEDDLILLLVGRNNTAAPVAPSGFTPYANAAGGVGNLLNIFWRRATGNESWPVNVAFSPDAAETKRGFVQVWKGVAWMPPGNYSEGELARGSSDVDFHAWTTSYTWGTDMVHMTFNGYAYDVGAVVGNPYATDENGVTHTLQGRPSEGSGNPTILASRGLGSAVYTVSHDAVIDLSASAGNPGATITGAWYYTPETGTTFTAPAASGGVVAGGSAQTEQQSDQFGGAAVASLSASASLDVRRVLVPAPMLASLSASALGMNMELAANITAVGLATADLSVPKRLEADAAGVSALTGALRDYRYVHGLLSASLVQPIARTLLQGTLIVAQHGQADVRVMDLTHRRARGSASATLHAQVMGDLSTGDTLTVLVRYLVGDVTTDVELMVGTIATVRDDDTRTEITLTAAEPILAPRAFTNVKRLYYSNQRTRYEFLLGLRHGDAVNGLPVAEVVSYLSTGQQMTEVVHG
jgi:hypothetical protein